MTDMRVMMGRHARAGRVEWIGVRPERDQDMLAVVRALAIAGRGLQDDRHMRNRPGGKRQLTLIQLEHMDVVEKLMDRGTIEPQWLRRNIVVSGINLNALQKSAFRIGAVELLGTGLCHPCSKMEKVLGEGGYNAMRGHGGITCQILHGGWIEVGDLVTSTPEYRG